MNKNKILGLVLVGSVLCSGFVIKNNFEKQNSFEFSWKMEKEKQIEAMDNIEDEMDANTDYYLEEILQQLKDKLSKEEYSKVELLADQLEKINEEEMKLEEKYNEIYSEIDEIAQNNEIELNDEFQEESTIVASYEANLGKVDFEKFKIDIEKHKEIWDRVIKLYPKEYLNKIITFKIETDGVDGIMASVAPLEDSNSKFELAVDDKDALDSNGKMIKELDNTLVHELAHIITLNEKQLDYTSEEEKDAKTFVIEEGITKENSYLNKFYNEFWTEIFKEVNKIEELSASFPEKAEELSYEFYEKHQDQFVSDYAATNPVEDIAESFTHFIVEEKPSTSKIKDKKILFFYQFKELVELRTQIRKNL